MSVQLAVHLHRECHWVIVGHACRVCKIGTLAAHMSPRALPIIPANSLSGLATAKLRRSRRD